MACKPISCIAFNSNFPKGNRLSTVTSECPVSVTSVALGGRRTTDRVTLQYSVHAQPAGDPIVYGFQHVFLETLFIYWFNCAYIRLSSGFSLIKRQTLNNSNITVFTYFFL